MVMEKINVAELLRDCPKNMELDCTAFNNVKFQCADNDRIWIEYIDSDNNNRVIYLTCEGGIKIKNIETKCVIYPKGKTTWEGFIPPCKFKDGDIVATDSGRWLGIIKNKYNSEYYTVHCAIDYTFNDIFYRCGEYRFSRLATEEEKQKLFQAIKDNGYKWNTETKTLEKLTEPKFKVGDKVKDKNNFTYTVLSIKRRGYILNDIYRTCVTFGDQDKYELVPNKFDITTLKPFESRVLVRNDEGQYWVPAFWGCKRADGYTTTFGWCKYCIPFGGNEHLLETNNDCDEYFKTWK